MTLIGWLQIALAVGLVLATVAPLGAYMARVYAGEVRFLAPVENGFYALAGIDPRREQSWAGYTMAMLAFNAAGFALLYGILRLQDVLPLNPAGMPAVPPDLAFNTAVSFTTNTNWQAYGGEATLSHFSQMAGLTVQNFVSAATGMAIAIAFARAFARSGATTIGNFWADMTRSTLYVLLPLALVMALAMVLLGLPQNLSGPVEATTLEGGKQAIAQGPVASQLAIKMLGTNGGGFFNANSAHPYENPTAWTNLLELWAILAVAAALTATFGRIVGDRAQGRALLAAMLVMLGAGIVACYGAEAAGNPILAKLGLTEAANWEGKETRFGIATSSLWAVFTTAASNGSVNAMHDSFTPLGGLVPMFNIQLGEIVIGGVGAGLYGMLLYAILAVFVAGLMVGRTPEYLGKKIGGREVKLTMLALLISPMTILVFTALACVWPGAAESLANQGPHGFGEYLYAYSSGAGNNGSAFAGLSANTPFFNITIGLAMLFGRFLMIVPMLAVAGSLVAKPKVEPGAGTFPTTGPIWVGLLVGVILILGGLTFFPALALGPLVEHFAMQAGDLF
ncbi:potassium-transporting ATPase subunit KdpA [Desertibaculum subflavum]|uniref:potassium-transporting ATPase subunit KdpA n=1 Tax=Desertibaculum subflavum TaxID=2268458 RepID=UPI000E66C7C7